MGMAINPVPGPEQQVITDLFPKVPVPVPHLAWAISWLALVHAAPQVWESLRPSDRAVIVHRFPVAQTEEAWRRKVKSVDEVAALTRLPRGEVWEAEKIFLRAARHPAIAERVMAAQAALMTRD